MALNNLTRVTSSGFGTNTNINTAGIITAASFSGDGSGLTGITALGSGVVVQEEGSNVGTAQTINFIGTGVTATFSGGIASVEITTSSGGGGGGLSNVVEDTAPQLGGNLDLNSNNITGTGDINITGDTIVGAGLSVVGVSTFNGQLNADTISANTISLSSSISAVSSSSNLNWGSGNFYFNSGSPEIGWTSGNGTLRALGASANISIKGGSPGENMGVFNVGGAAELYYNNSKKFETTNTGAVVTGILTATSFSGDGSALTGLTGASAATYGNGTVVPQITVDANGRITTISNVSISGGGGGGGTTMFIRDSGSLVGAAGTIDFGTNLSVSSVSAGIVTVTSGINTAIINADTLNVSGIATFTSGLTVPSTSAITIGAGGSKLTLASNGSGSQTDIRNTGSGTIRYRADQHDFMNSAATGTPFSVNSDSSVTLSHSNIPVLKTVGSGVTIGIPNYPATLFTNQLNVSGISTFQGNAEFTSSVTANSFIKSGGTSSQYLMADGSVTTSSGISTAFTNVQATWSLGANGTSAYRFTGPGNDGTEDNPDIYLVRGQKYRFTNNSGGSHPFEIRSAVGGSAYSDGVTNNNAASGNIEINVQHDAPARLFYQCSSHSGMVGNIYVVGGSDWRMTDVNTSTDPEIYTDRYVGIGTDNPLMALHVHGAANSADSRIRLSSAEGSGLTIRAQSATENNINADGGEHITFSRGNVESLRITSSGNVGIQTNNPYGKLHIGSAAVEDAVNDVDTTNTSLVIKQSTNTRDDGIYIEREGERKGYYMWLNPGGGAGDGLTFTRNNNGTKTNALILDREANAHFGGNAVFASGNGIDFSATTDASGSTSELFDDYEEGTWTPTTTQFAGYTSSGRYTKIGRIVYIEGIITRNTATAPNAVNLQAQSLPFTVNNISSVVSGNYWLDEGGPTQNQGDSVGSAYFIGSGTTVIFLRPTDPSNQASARYVQADEVTNSRGVSFYGWYRV